MRIDHTGKRFGRLVVIGDAPNRCSRGRSYRMLECVCDCGSTKITYAQSLKSGETTSCGCFAKEEIGRRNRTHHMSKTTEYDVWHALMKRARGTCDRSRYAERGIGVCERWNRFENFFEDMGPRPSKDHSIDRKDNDGPYCKENCRWATRKQQARNKQRTLYAVFEGVKTPLSELSERHGLNHSAVRGRMRLGWSVERALTTPIAIQRPKKRNITKP